jgi:hypothetical protein
MREIINCPKCNYTGAVKEIKHKSCWVLETIDCSGCHFFQTTKYKDLMLCFQD